MDASSFGVVDDPIDSSPGRRSDEFIEESYQVVVGDVVTTHHSRPSSAAAPQQTFTGDEADAGDDDLDEDECDEEEVEEDEDCPVVYAEQCISPDHAVVQMRYVVDGEVSDVDVEMNSEGPSHLASSHFQQDKTPSPFPEENCDEARREESSVFDSDFSVPPDDDSLTQPFGHDVAMACDSDAPPQERIEATTSDALMLTEQAEDAGVDPSCSRMSGGMDPVLDEGAMNANKEDAVASKRGRTTFEDMIVSFQQQRAIADDSNADRIVGLTHCVMCGIDMAPIFTKYHRNTKGPPRLRNKWTFRWRCSRKKCFKFYGDQWMYDSVPGKWFLQQKDGIMSTRPFIDAPREQKFPPEEYVTASLQVPGDIFISEYARGKKDADDMDTAESSQDSTSSASATPSKQRPPAKRKVPEYIPKNPVRSSSQNGKKTPSEASASPLGLVSVPPPKKPKKGYIYITEPMGGPVLPPDNTNSQSAAAGGMPPTPLAEVRVETGDVGTQTGDEQHKLSALIERVNADTRQDKEEQVTAGVGASAAVGTASAREARMVRQLMLMKECLAKQTAKSRRLENENKRLVETLTNTRDIVTQFSTSYAGDLRRLRDDVECTKREMRFYHEELKTDSHKSAAAIRDSHDKIDIKLDDMDRAHNKTSALLEFCTRELDKHKQRIEFLQYNKDMVDKEIVWAHRERDDALAKLNDKIYLTTHTKCTNCKVSDNMKEYLTQQIADRAVQLEKACKERDSLRMRAEQAERMAQIVSKDIEKARFEARTWEADARKSNEELQRIKAGMSNGGGGSQSQANTPSSSGSVGGGGAPTPLHESDPTTTAPATAAQPPAVERIRSSDSPMEPGEVRSPHQQPQSPSQLSPAALAALPPPPEPPHAFSNWVKSTPRAQKTPLPPQSPLQSLPVPEELKKKLAEQSIAERVGLVPPVASRPPPPAGDDAPVSFFNQPVTAKSTWVPTHKPRSMNEAFTGHTISGNRNPHTPGVESVGMSSSMVGGAGAGPGDPKKLSKKARKRLEKEKREREELAKLNEKKDEKKREENVRRAEEKKKRDEERQKLLPPKKPEEERKKIPSRPLTGRFVNATRVAEQLMLKKSQSQQCDGTHVSLRLGVGPNDPLPSEKEKSDEAFVEKDNEKDVIKGIPGLNDPKHPVSNKTPQRSDKAGDSPAKSAPEKETKESGEKTTTSATSSKQPRAAGDEKRPDPWQQPYNGPVPKRADDVPNRIRDAEQPRAPVNRSGWEGSLPWHQQHQKQHPQQSPRVWDESWGKRGGGSVGRGWNAGGHLPPQHAPPMNARPPGMHGAAGGSGAVGFWEQQNQPRRPPYNGPAGMPPRDFSAQQRRNFWD